MELIENLATEITYTLIAIAIGGLLVLFFKWFNNRKK